MDHGLCSAGSILRKAHPDLIISKQKLRKIQGVEMVRLKRDQNCQTLGFTSRPFVLCGLPIRRPRSSQLLYERRNGHFVLQVAGHPEFGLPFGQDRLVPIFLATLAVRQKSQAVRFRSAAEMLDTFGMAKGGKEYRRLVAAFERIFGATIFFGTESMRSTVRVVHHSRFNFLREAQIWYSRDEHQPTLSEDFENVIVLSDEFYREITEHPIPADMDAVKLLAPSPGVLDLFMWLTYRCFTAKGVERVPLFGEFGLVHQLGTVEYSRRRRFRAMIEEWLNAIRRIWPTCPACISPDGRCLQLTRGVSVQPTSALG